MADSPDYEIRVPKIDLPERRPLFRPISAASEFPASALGPLQEAAEAIQLMTQAPLAICAQSVLATATLAVQAHRDVLLPSGGRAPLTGLFASIAESGERKTTVDRIALKPVYQIEESWRQQREAQMIDYLNNKDAFQVAREHAKKQHKGNRQKIKEALDQIGSEPKPPPQPMLLVEDFSPEALVLHLRDSRSNCGLFSSEGGALVGGHAFSEEKAMQTGSLLNTLWDGGPIRRARVMTGNAFLPGRRCSVHVMMQNIVATKLLGDAVLEGIGLMARMLVVAPESTVGSRLFRDTASVGTEGLRFYNDRMMSLLTREPRTQPDAPDVLDPAIIELSYDARQMWITFYNATEASLGEGGELQPIRAFGAKLAEHACRLASVLEVFAEPDATSVSAKMMACGIELAKHYACEMLRLRGGAVVPPDLKLADELATWMKRHGGRCHLAAIYQKGPHALRDAKRARHIIGILEEHGWVRRLPEGTTIDGSARKEAFGLV